MVSLSRCPFCGERSISSFVRNGSWRAKCPSCTASGPERATESAAASAWNRREAGGFLPPTPSDLAWSLDDQRSRSRERLEVVLFVVGIALALLAVLAISLT